MIPIGRTVLGFLMAFCASLSFLLLVVLISEPRNELLLPMLGPYAAGAGFVIATSLVLGALPLLLVLERLRYRKLWPYLSVAILLGIAFVFLFEPFGRDALPALVQQAVVSSSVGAVAAFVLWLTFVRLIARDAT